MSRLRAALLAIAVVSSFMGILAASAGAQIVVGQTASATTPPLHCSFENSYDEVQTGVAGGTSYVVPTSGAITSWSTYAHEGPNQVFELKVFRPLGPLSYLVVGSDVRKLTPGGLNTFETKIAVQAGDVLGVNEPSAFEIPCVFQTGLPGDQIRFAKGIVSTGKSVEFKPADFESGFRLNVSASVLPPPSISAIAPAKGSIRGATVTISGTNFANIKSVNFGSQFANYNVVSETEITAKAPSSLKLTKVPVTVTTDAGTATAPQPFAYEGCKVPQLRNLKLPAAKRKLRKANCRLGHVKKLHGADPKTGRVAKQSPRPGLILAPQARVKVTLDT